VSSVLEPQGTTSCHTARRKRCRRKEVFENGAAVFEKIDKDKVHAEQRRVSELEAKPNKKDTVIAEIMEDLIVEEEGRGAL
jgi:hypothetical protein